MPEAEILHRLYTNALESSASDEAQARFIRVDERDASDALPSAVVDALDDLLRKTTPCTTQTGWAVRRFLAGDKHYVCVVASYPDFDAGQKRQGFLNHARLVQVAGPSFDARALVDAVKDFPYVEVCEAPAGERLRVYRNLIKSSEDSVNVLPTAVSELQPLPPALLEGVLLGCLGTLGAGQHVPMTIGYNDELLIANAWAALPFAAQRTSSWGFRVTENCPVDVVFTTGQLNVEHKFSDVLRERINEYVALLHQAPDRISAMLADPKLKDATAFASAVQKAVIGVPLSNATLRKDEMSKKNNRAEWQPVDAGATQEINRQLRASEEILRRVVDERIADAERALRAQSPGNAGVSRMMPWLIGLCATVMVMTLASLGLSIYALRELRREPRPVATVPETQDTTPSEPRSAPDEPPRVINPVTEAIASADTSQDWPEALKRVLQEDGVFVARAIVELANRQEVPDAANRQLISLTTPISQNQDLGSDQRRRLRALLVDALAGLEYADVAIDGNLDDVTPRHVDVLKTRYDVRTAAGSPTDMKLQSEIILRWLASVDR